MDKIILVGCGGFVGAAGRYGVSLLLDKRGMLVGFPLATLAVNLIGAFLIGFFTQLFANNFPQREKLKLFLTTGIMGGFTTFSTFSLETMNLFQQGKALAACVNVVLSVGLCLAGVFFGKLLADSLPA